MKKINNKEIITDNFINIVLLRFNELVNKKQSSFYKMYSSNNVLYKKGNIKNDLFLELIKGKLSDKYFNELSKICYIKKDVNKIFLNFYETFRNEFGGEFVKLFYNKGIRVCPYCNINSFDYIVNNSTKLVPTLDHIDNKSNDYIKNSINLFNLIPTCYTCNSQLKKEEELPTNTNPFDNKIKDLHDRFYFKVNSKSGIISNVIIGNEINIEILEKKGEIIDTDLKCYIDLDSKVNNKVSFGIKQRIQSNNYIVKDLFLKSYSHNKLFEEMVLNKLFGKEDNYIKEYGNLFTEYKNIHKLPYSKLYLDINEIYFKKT